MGRLQYYYNIDFENLRMASSSSSMQLFSSVSPLPSSFSYFPSAMKERGIETGPSFFRKNAQKYANCGIAFVMTLRCGRRLKCTMTWEAWRSSCVVTLLIAAMTTLLRLTFGTLVLMIFSITSLIGSVYLSLQLKIRPISKFSSENLDFTR